MKLIAALLLTAVHAKLAPVHLAKKSGVKAVQAIDLGGGKKAAGAGYGGAGRIGDGIGIGDGDGIGDSAGGIGAAFAGSAPAMVLDRHCDGLTASVREAQWRRQRR